MLDSAAARWYKGRMIIEDVICCECCQCKNVFWVPWDEGGVTEVALPGWCPFCGCEYNEYSDLEGYEER